MIATIFNVIFAILFKIIEVLLIPINLLIAQYIPDLNQSLLLLGQFFQLIATGIGWAISATGIPYPVVAFVVTVIIYNLTLPWLLHGIKLALQWFRTFR